MKLCKDCAYCEPALGVRPEDKLEYAKCKRTFVPKTDPVSGKVGLAYFEYCFSERVAPETTGVFFKKPTNRCGPSGRFWEPKDV